MTMPKYKNEEHKRLRNEFCKPSFRTKLFCELGNKCINCGSDVSVQYHHIVPLVLGGTNNIGNIVPLCHVCHQKAHGGRTIRENNKSGGRKRVAFTEYEKNCIEEYLKGYIGRAELNKKIGKVDVVRSERFDRYVKDQKIDSYFNFIDLWDNSPNVNRTSKLDKVVAQIKYTDGTIYSRLYGDYISKKTLERLPLIQSLTNI